MSDAPQMFADGQAYERRMGRWSKLAGEVFLDWLDLPRGLRWVDVGCGNGAFTAVLIARQAPAEIVGIDPSEGQLAFARLRPEAKLAQFRRGDAQALPLADASVDAASMALVISFVPDPAKAAAEMARVVRPGGWMAAYMWDLPGGGFPLRPVAAALQSLGLGVPAQPGVEVSRLEALHALWQGAGLEAIETRVIRITVAYADFDDFWDSISGPDGPSGNAIGKLPADARERLKAHLREQLPKSADGGIVYPAHANAVKGRVPG